MRLHCLFFLPFFAGLLAVATEMALADHPTKDRNPCAAIDDDSERLTCYDGLEIWKMPAAPADTAATAAPESSAMEISSLQEDVVSPDQLFGLGADAIRRSYEEASGEDTLTELRASVTEIRAAGIDRVLLMLDNGQIWRQVDTTNLRIKVGDAVVIHKAAFGSFKLNKDGSNRSMRVNRAK